MTTPSFPGHVAAVALAVATPLAAQAFVSPAAFANRAGNTLSFSIPLHQAPYVRQQIHGDVPAMTMSRLAWRHFPVTVFAPARTADIELSIGDADVTNPSETFAANFLAPPTRITARRQVQLPAWAPGTPHVFDHVIPFDRPYVHTGIHDLCYQLVVHSANGSGNTFADTARYWPNHQNHGVDTGSSGCTVGVNLYGQIVQQPVELRTRFVSDHFGGTMSMHWSFSHVPQPRLVMIGTRTAQVPLPGMCGSLLIGQIISPDLGAVVQLPILPFLVGVPIHSQAIGFDPRHPAAIAISNRDTNMFPPIPVPPQPVVSIASFGSATTGQIATSFGVITEFR